MDQPKWGPSGQVVYERTYQRPKADGTKETWLETVQRVAAGNLGLVYGERGEWSDEVVQEYETLVDLMFDFKIIPAGRHLWASGIKGRQYLFNCFVSHWTPTMSTHFDFTFMRLMEGGGVGASYSSKYLAQYGAPRRSLKIHIVCDPLHPDYDKLKSEGLLSNEYSYEWTGAFPVEDSREGWASALVDFLDTYMTDDLVKHADRVYDVSRVRAEGQPLRTFGGSASGPTPFARMMIEICQIMNGSDAWRAGHEERAHLTPLEAMEIDHAIASCVVAGGNRRSARMSMVHWDDPWVFDFINCKTDYTKHWSTNISVEIDDRFIADLDVEGSKANQVLSLVVEGMLNNGEPGLWNSSLSNVDEPSPTVCTNPCGEINLNAWEPCNLGHINMGAFAGNEKFIDINGKLFMRADEDSVLKAHQLMTRFLIRATYGDVTDPKQAEVLAKNRRIGLGHLGVQALLAKSSISFTEAPENRYFTELLQKCYRAVRQEARDYAFQLRIPEPVKVTTVAPTGSIAKLPGTTEGIHPIYARHFIRRIRFSTVDPAQRAKLLEFEAQGYRVEPCQYAENTMVVEFPTKESLVEEVEALGLDAETLVQSANEIPLERMLAFQAMYQTHYVDNSIAFTVNVPEGSLSVEEVIKTLKDYLPVLKGTTIMPDGTRPQAPYERISAGQYAQLTGPKDVADSTDEECSNGSCPVR